MVAFLTVCSCRPSHRLHVNASFIPKHVRHLKPQARMPSADEGYVTWSLHACRAALSCTPDASMAGLRTWCAAGPHATVLAWLPRRLPSQTEQSGIEISVSKLVMLAAIKHSFMHVRTQNVVLQRWQGSRLRCHLLQAARILLHPGWRHLCALPFFPGAALSDNCTHSVGHTRQMGCSWRCDCRPCVL